MRRFHITVSSRSRDQMLDLRRIHKIQILDHGAHQTREGIFTVQAIAEQSIIRTLENAGYDVAVHEDVDEIGKRRQAEVGKGNRFLSQ